MGIYIEALILYIVLFLAGSVAAMGSLAGNLQQEVLQFSAIAEINKTLLYSIPSLGLIWYLLKIKKTPDEAKNWQLKPCGKDLVSGFIAFPCLLLTGIIIAIVSGNLNIQPVQTISVYPASFLDWTVLSFSCIFAAYLEESFFRLYLLSKRKEFNLGQIQALILSTLLFSLCHIYEGPFGWMNSCISGAVLAFLYLRYNSFHGIAIAHGLYNITVFVINSLLI